MFCGGWRYGLSNETEKVDSGSQLQSAAKYFLLVLFDQDSERNSECLGLLYSEHEINKDSQRSHGFVFSSFFAWREENSGSFGCSFVRPYVVGMTKETEIPARFSYNRVRKWEEN